MLETFPWSRLDPREGAAVAGAFLSAAGVPGAFGDAPLVLRAELPFYSDFRLVYLAPVEDGGLQPSFMFLESDEGVILLNGESSAVHQANAMDEVRITPDTGADYLRFFCFFVHGGEGPFHLVEPPPPGRPGVAPPEPPLSPVIARHAEPVAFLGPDDRGRLRYRGVIAYGDAVFRATFALYPEGMVEMLDDDVLESGIAEEDRILWPPLLRPGMLRAAHGEAPAGPVGGLVLRESVRGLFEQALHEAASHRLLSHFNGALPGQDPVSQFAHLVASASPVVIVEGSIPFLEEMVAELVNEVLDPANRLPVLAAEADGGDDTRLRPRVPPAGRGILTLSFHAYRSVADVERFAHQASTREVAVLIGCESAADVPEPLRRVADLEVSLPRLTPALFQALFHTLTESPLPEGWQADGAPWLRYVLPSDFEQPRGLGLRSSEALAFIRERAEQRLRAVDPADSFGLEDLHGIGVARDFAEDLIADLHTAMAGEIPWSAVDRGALLVGPPGTGKTTLAKAIARDCGVKFVAASATSWQAAGHLGDHIRAMRADFATARRYSPSILFIDEIDSVGSREHFSGQNAQYSTEVVNALLELMQGLDVDAPVVVLAATNHADRVDPALRRSGRLDRVIEIPYPSSDALAKIFRHHLSRLAPEIDEAGLDLPGVAALSLGMTGADVERLVRGAVRRARKEGRAVARQDLMDEVLGITRTGDVAPPLGPDELRRVAVHEAGHALASCLTRTGGDEIAYVSIVPRADGSLGFVARAPSERRLLTAAEYREQMEIMLGGRAAEEIVFGPDGVTGGAGGGSESSDLARASSLALHMIAQAGLGPDGGLFWSPSPHVQDVQEAERLLGETYASVKGKLAQRRDVLEKLAALLMERQELVGEEVRGLVG